jgi:hypothetical protein
VARQVASILTVGSTSSYCLLHQDDGRTLAAAIHIINTRNRSLAAVHCDVNRFIDERLLKMSPDTPSLANESFIDYPINRVAGTITDDGDAEAAVKSLLQAGIDADDIDVLHGDAGLRRLDPKGSDHGLLARFQRALIHAAAVNEESAALEHHVNDLRAGRFVIMARAKTANERRTIATVLKEHGATFVGFFGRWTLRSLDDVQTSNADRDDPVVNHTYEVDLHGTTTQLRVETGWTVDILPEGGAPIRTVATIIGSGLFITSWHEPGKHTVVQVSDVDAGKVFATIVGLDGTPRQVNGVLRRLH